MIPILPENLSPTDLRQINTLATRFSLTSSQAWLLLRMAADDRVLVEIALVGAVIAEEEAFDGALRRLTGQG
jgi:hypothetical protein